MPLLENRNAKKNPETNIKSVKLTARDSNPNLVLKRGNKLRVLRVAENFNELSPLPQLTNYKNSHKSLKRKNKRLLIKPSLIAEAKMIGGGSQKKQNKKGLDANPAQDIHFKATNSIQNPQKTPEFLLPK